MNFIDAVMNACPPQKIAIVRALPGLGDFLCSVPALRAIRKAFPRAEITLIGLPSVRELVSRFDEFLDRWLEFPGFPNIPEVPYQASRTAAFLAEARSYQFDLALQMHGNGSCMNPLVLQLGAKVTAGFCLGQPPHSNFFPYPDDEPEVRRSLRLLEYLNIPTCGEHLEFPVKAADWNPVLDRPYLCLHPGASAADKCWSPQFFAQVAEVLSIQGFQIVLTGTDSEAVLNQSIAKAMNGAVIDLTGKTDLDTLASLLKQSHLLICNDTGVSHLVDALQVKSVVIFSKSDPARWSPLDRQKHRIVTLDRALPDHVLREAFDLLDLGVSYAA
ncbi:MAG: glycosyltransferase family 9 protein [Leptolyngbya sp. Prado105]|jgi:ADP-heptose:LPS heptosyltransferase|nr:glycosyltransferase family 9 protein [Leptolyngbya sp. Prado105]